MRIRIDPYQTERKDPDQHPEPHQRDGSGSFADDKPKCMAYEHIQALFRGFEPLFGSQGTDPDTQQNESYDPGPDQSDKQDTDPHRSEMQDSDSHQSDADPQN